MPMNFKKKIKKKKYSVTKKRFLKSEKDGDLQKNSEKNGLSTVQIH